MGVDHFCVVKKNYFVINSDQNLQNSSPVKTPVLSDYNGEQKNDQRYIGVIESSSLSHHTETITNKTVFQKLS